MSTPERSASNMSAREQTAAKPDEHSAEEAAPVVEEGDEATSGRSPLAKRLTSPFEAPEIAGYHSSSIEDEDYEGSEEKIHEAVVILQYSGTTENLAYLEELKSSEMTSAMPSDAESNAEDEEPNENSNLLDAKARQQQLQQHQHASLRRENSDVSAHFKRASEKPTTSKKAASHSHAASLLSKSGIATKRRATPSRYVSKDDSAYLNRNQHSNSSDSTLRRFSLYNPRLAAPYAIERAPTADSLASSKKSLNSISATPRFYLTPLSSKIGRLSGKEPAVPTFQYTNHDSDSNNEYAIKARKNADIEEDDSVGFTNESSFRKRPVKANPHLTVSNYKGGLIVSKKNNAAAALNENVLRRNSMNSDRPSLYKFDAGIGKSTNSNQRITINIGGVRYETYAKTLKIIPQSRLADLTITNSDYDQVRNEYFFDRDPESFLAILNFYRTGELHAPAGVCGNLFFEELNFWGIPETNIQPCCWTEYSGTRNCDEILRKVVEGMQDKDDDYDEPEDYSEQFDPFPYTTQGSNQHKGKVSLVWSIYHFLSTKARPTIWRFLGDRNSSIGAKIYFWISVVFLVLSLFNFVAETYPACRRPYHIAVNKTLSRRYRDEFTRPHDSLLMIELVCNIFFAIEYTLKFLSSPNKLKFLRTPYNILEFLAIFPLFWPAHFDSTKSRSLGVIIHNYVEVFYILRILRIFTLVPKYSGLRVLLITLKNSIGELLLYVMMLLMAVMIFASFAFYAEQIFEVEDNKFDSILIGLWWAVVTMTTLGYGDIVPATPFGYIVGALCAVCGLIFLALPVPVIVQNFTTFYTHAKARQRLREHTERQKLLPKQARAYHFHPAFDLSKSTTGINEYSAEDEERNEEESSGDLPTLPYGRRGMVKPPTAKFLHMSKSKQKKSHFGKNLTDLYRYKKKRLRVQKVELEKSRLVRLQKRLNTLRQIKNRRRNAIS